MSIYGYFVRLDRNLVSKEGHSGVNKGWMEGGRGGGWPSKLFASLPTKKKKKNKGPNFSIYIYIYIQRKDVDRSVWGYVTLFFSVSFSFAFVIFFSFFFLVNCPAANNKLRLFARLGLCTGKQEVANYLVQEHNFKVLRLESPAPEHSSGPAPINEVASPGSVGRQEHVAERFASAKELLHHVTQRWRDRFVTTDVRSEKVLEILLRRPFFILVSVDAPVSVRWKRYKER